MPVHGPLDDTQIEFKPQSGDEGTAHPSATETFMRALLLESTPKLENRVGERRGI